jgi:endo-1,4-beta-xylanase
VTLGLPSGDTIVNIWNGADNGTSGTITVSNLSYNGSLAAGATTNWGFQANGSATGTTVSCTPA